MHLLKFGSKEEIAREAAADVAQLLRSILRRQPGVCIIVDTDASQQFFLAGLARVKAIHWNRVSVFLLGEYVGLPALHSASLGRYFQKHFAGRTRLSPGEVHHVRAGADPQTECRRLSAVITDVPIDLAFIGIGDNGRLALNNPPADLDTDEPYLTVELSEAYRTHLVEEALFETSEEVPAQAVSMSIRQIMRSAEIVCCVPEAQRAEAVRSVIEGPVTPDVPASILQQHRSVTMYLDTDSASLLS